MNSLYFFLPFILIAGTGILQESFALESYRGEDYLDVTNPDGLHTSTFGLPHFVQNGYDEKWRPIFVPYILEQTPTFIKYETGSVSWIFSKESCTMKLYTSGIIDEPLNPIIKNVSWTMQEQVNGTWTNTIHNNYDCEVTISELANDTVQLIAKQGDEIVGFKEIELKQKGGESLESFMRTPNASFDGQIFGFTESHIKTQALLINDIIFTGSVQVEQVFNATEFVDNGKDIPIQTSNQNGQLSFDTKNTIHNTLTDVTVKNYNPDELQTVYDFHNTMPLLEGESLEIDPTYSSATPTDGTVTDDGNDNVCNNASTITKDTAVITLNMYSPAAAIVVDCTRPYLDYNISSIPSVATVTNSVFKFHTSFDDVAQNCDIISMGTTRASDTGLNIFNAITSGTVILDNNSFCDGVSTNKSIDLGAVGDSEIQTRVSASSGFFTFGMKLQDENALPGATTYNEIVSTEGTGTPDPTLEITYTVPNCTPDEPTDLLARYINSTALIITWTAPTNCVITYQTVEVQHSTTGAFAGEETTLYSSTPKTTHNHSVTIVNEVQYYQIRYQSSVDEGSLWGAYDSTVATIEVGLIAISASNNQNELPITFTPYELDADTTNMTVTYDSSYNLACDFRYAIGGTNTTYTGLTENPVTGTEVYSNFTINGVDNDIIDIYCWDQLDNSTDGSERLGQSNVPLFNQIENFQDGVFGTSGKFGALDLMSLIIVIVSMIAFNRTHPYIGVIVMVAMFSVAGYYGLVQPITVMSGFLILVVVLAIAYGRRDSES